MFGTIIASAITTSLFMKAYANGKKIEAYKGLSRQEARRFYHHINHIWENEKTRGQVHIFFVDGETQLEYNPKRSFAGTSFKKGDGLLTADKIIEEIKHSITSNGFFEYVGKVVVINDKYADVYNVVFRDQNVSMVKINGFQIW